MTNVTKRTLKNNTRAKIEGQFANFISTLSAEEAEDFLQSFFTESEQIMFVKRLAIIMMLEQSVPYLHIAKTLQVSSSTVDRIDSQKETGKFDAFCNLFASEKQTKKFWNIIGILVDENVHHYGAQGWGWLDKIEEISE